MGRITPLELESLLLEIPEPRRLIVFEGEDNVDGVPEPIELDPTRNPRKAKFRNLPAQRSMANFRATVKAHHRNKAFQVFLQEQNLHIMFLENEIKKFIGLLKSREHSHKATPFLDGLRTPLSALSDQKLRKIILTCYFSDSGKMDLEKIDLTEKYFLIFLESVFDKKFITDEPPYEVIARAQSSSYMRRPVIEEEKAIVEEPLLIQELLPEPQSKGMEAPINRLVKEAALNTLNYLIKVVASDLGGDIAKSDKLTDLLYSLLGKVEVFLSDKGIEELDVPEN